MTRQFQTDEEVTAALQPETKFFRLYGGEKELHEQIVISNTDGHIRSVYISSVGGGMYITDDYVADMQNFQSKAVFTDKFMAKAWMEEHPLLMDGTTHESRHGYSGI